MIVVDVHQGQVGVVVAELGPLGTSKMLGVDLLPTKRIL